MITYLILDYNRPNETLKCLNSILQKTRFPFQIIYLSNGGEQDYVIELYKQGVINKLILRKDNSGCGLGTRELFKVCETEYAIYVQNDQFLVRDYTEELLAEHIALIETNNYAHVDLSGDQGRGRYSERAHIINTAFYNSIPNGVGGPGPYANQKWTEECVQDYYRENDLKIFVEQPLLFADNGKVSIREFPCGGVTLHFTDTKQLWIVKPLQKRYEDYHNLALNDHEWEQVLAGEWINGSIPERLRSQSFVVWQ